MSQPCDKNCDVPQPGELDAELQEFWEGSPWDIFREHNLSSFERNRTFLNVEGRSFLDISYLTGADTDSDSRSVLALDLRNNGQLDLIVRQVGGGPLQIYRNRFPARNFLKVSLRGRKSNRLGIGARLTLTAGETVQLRELYPRNTYRSQLPALVHFGLDNSQPERLVVQWPSGEEQTFTDLPTNSHLVLTEGEDAIELVEAGQTIEP